MPRPLPPKVAEALASAHGVDDPTDQAAVLDALAAEQNAAREYMAAYNANPPTPEEAPSE